MIPRGLRADCSKSKQNALLSHKATEVGHFRHSVMLNSTRHCPHTHTHTLPPVVELCMDEMRVGSK